MLKSSLYDWQLIPKIPLEAISDMQGSCRLRVSQGKVKGENCFVVSEGCVFSHWSTSPLSALAELRLQSRKRGCPMKIVVRQQMQSLVIGDRGPLPKEGPHPSSQYLLVPTWHFPGHI